MDSDAGARTSQLSARVDNLAAVGQVDKPQEVLEVGSAALRMRELGQGMGVAAPARTIDMELELEADKDAVAAMVGRRSSLVEDKDGELVVAAGLLNKPICSCSICRDLLCIRRCTRTSCMGHNIDCSGIRCRDSMLKGIGMECRGRGRRAVAHLHIFCTGCGSATHASLQLLS